MKVIPTDYDGFRFRSRLEARWAVFFDVAGIDFLYESEGVIVPSTVVKGWTKDRVQYLPDFYLPDYGLWVECKAQWSPPEAAKAFNAAAHLSANGADVLLAPDIFRQPRGGARLPWLLRLEDGDLTAHPWPPPPGSLPVELVASSTDPTVFQDAPDLLRGFKHDEPAPDWFRSAARAAQRARFEFGEAPTRP